MDTRLNRWIKLLAHHSPGSLSLKICRSLSGAEAESLDSQGHLPTKERLGEIARQAETSEDVVVRHLKGYLYKFSEKIHYLREDM